MKQIIVFFMGLSLVPQPVFSQQPGCCSWEKEDQVTNKLAPLIGKAKIVAVFGSDTIPDAFRNAEN